MDTLWQMVAVQVVESQVVLVVRMELPHFMQHDNKLQRVCQGHCKIVILVYLKVYAEEEKR